MSKRYVVNECFYSPQGEGARAGSMNVFLRFAGCNLQCVVADRLARPLKGNEVDAGFFCDTDFRKGDRLSLVEVSELVRKTDEGGCGWVICTGGEPTLQLDYALVDELHEQGYKVAVETNGTRGADKWPLHYVDWISCSPKRGTKTILRRADEVRVVLPPDGTEPDDHGIEADHYFVSPAFKAPSASGMWGDWKKRLGEPPVDGALARAIEFVKANPRWKLSEQQHKRWGVR